MDIKQIHGKKLSYNNYNDIFSALTISKSLPKNIGTVIVKHSNPCGVSIKNNPFNSYQSALACDPISAFGGIVACNYKIKKKLAVQLNKIFLEVVVSNGFEKDALKILKKKKNLRLIDASNLSVSSISNFISNFNSILFQTSDIKKFTKTANDEWYYSVEEAKKYYHQPKIFSKIMKEGFSKLNYEYAAQLLTKLELKLL